MAGFRGLLELTGVWLAPGPRTTAPTPTPTASTIRLGVYTGALGIEAATGPIRVQAATEAIRTKVSTGGAS